MWRENFSCDSAADSDECLKSEFFAHYRHLLQATFWIVIAGKANVKLCKCEFINADSGPWSSPLSMYNTRTMMLSCYDKATCFLHVRFIELTTEMIRSSKWVKMRVTLDTVQWQSGTNQLRSTLTTLFNQTVKLLLLWIKLQWNKRTLHVGMT